MTKEEIIKKIVDDLPSSDLRGEMSKEEWYAWFEEAYDKGSAETRRKAFDEVREKLSDYAECTQFAIEILTEDIPDFKTE